MGKIIIVTGHLAALKTTISQRLGRDLSIICLNKDLIKEILGDTIGFTNREENLKLSRATFMLMKTYAEKMLEIDQNIILESNFKDFELTELRKMLGMNKHACLTLFLTGNDQTLFDRYVLRQASRHPVHTSAGLMTLKDFIESMNTVKKEDIIGESIEIDTTTFSEEDYELLVNKVSRFIKQ
jgi:predicted kinase